MSSGSTDENAFLSPESSSIQNQERFGPLDHLSAEQVESIYQRYLQGEKVSDLFMAYEIKTNTNSLLPLLPNLERNDLLCPYCTAPATQKRAARNRPSNRPLCTQCDHTFPIYREDVCGCIGCKGEYLSLLNGEGVQYRVVYDQLTLREKILLLAALTMASPSELNYFSCTMQKSWHSRLAPTAQYHDQCISALFSRRIIIVSSHTSADALAIFREYESYNFLWWVPNVSANDADELAFDIPSLRTLLAHDLLLNRAGLSSVLIELMYELAEEELIEYVYYRVGKSTVKFNAERATRAALRPLLASSSVSNVFSFIWKAVKQAERSLEKGVFKGGAVHAGNWIPTAVVGIAEEEKQDEYERLKGAKICQISEVIYSFILDDPDGSFKIPLPRYTAEVMRPVLEGISNAKQAKFARSWVN